MARVFFLPKISLKLCVAIVLMASLLLLAPNSGLSAVTGSLSLTDASRQQKVIFRTEETLHIQVTDTAADVSPLQTLSAVYNWKVVATDNHGATSTGPLWKFTAVAPLSGNLPGVPTGLKATVEGKIVYLEWDANTESDLDHYNLYAGYSSKKYNMTGSPFNIGNVSSLTASGVSEGTYYLALSAVNRDGQESSSSEEIKVVVSTKPIITISSNKNTYSPGDTLTLSFGINNPTGTTQTVILFLGIMGPDGSLYFFDFSLNFLMPAKVDDPKTFTPASASLALSPGYDLPIMPFFTAVLPSGLPAGAYQAFAALAEPASVRAGSPKIMGDMSIIFFHYYP